MRDPFSPFARIGGDVPVGQQYHDPERFTLRWRWRGECHRRTGVHRMIQRRDSGGGVDLNTVGATACPMPDEERRITPTFAAVGSFSSRVKVLEAGTYRVTYNVAMDNATAGTLGSVKTWLAKNGGAALAGSLSGGAAPSSVAPRLRGGATIVIDLAANDYLEVFGQRAGTGTAVCNTVADGVSMIVEQLTTSVVPSERVMSNKTGVIVGARISKGTSGTSGSTEFDVLKNGVSICTSAKLSVDYSASVTEFSSSSFTDLNIDSTETFTINVPSIDEDPTPLDVLVELLCVAR